MTQLRAEIVTCEPHILKFETNLSVQCSRYAHVMVYSCIFFNIGLVSVYGRHLKSKVADILNPWPRNNKNNKNARMECCNEI